MFNKKIEYLADMIVESDNSNSIEKDIIVYGLSSALEQGISILITVVLGVLFGLLFESFIFLISFSMIRIYAGGYHCKKSTHCYLISSGMMISALVLVKLIPIEYITSLSVILLLISVSVILKFAPVGAINKPLDNMEKKYYRKKTLFYLSLECCIIFIFFIAGMQKAAFVICLGITISAFLLIGQKIIFQLDS